MSRIGRKPIEIPDGVEIDVRPGAVAVKGPKGELSQRVDRDMKVERSDDGTVTVERPTDRGEHRALHGLTRSLIANMVEGVTDGFEQRLEIQGVGYRAQPAGQEPRDGAGLLAPGLDRGPGGHRVRGPAADRGRRSAVSTSNWSARSPPASASAARRSPTRARASATRASTSRRKVG